MNLTVTFTSVPLIKPGQKVSLFTHGANEVEIHGVNTSRPLRVFSPAICLHMKDEKTEIELNGYIDAGGDRGLLKEASFTLS